MNHVASKRSRTAPRAAAVAVATPDWIEERFHRVGDITSAQRNPPSGTSLRARPASRIRTDDQGRAHPARRREAVGRQSSKARRTAPPGDRRALVRLAELDAARRLAGDDGPARPQNERDGYEEAADERHGLAAKLSPTRSRPMTARCAVGGIRPS